LGGAPGARNDEIGYLPQRRVFDESTRVRGVDMVRLGLDGRRWGVPVPFASRFSARARGARERVAQAIARVGAEAYAGRPIGESPRRRTSTGGATRGTATSTRR
jgi:zinc/manganese transport system ATP-binding protein